jgi:magnesium-transporting ATPase (P-type)
MAEAGLRVLGAAWRPAAAGEDLSEPPASNLEWLGLVGMADPPRSGASNLVRALQRAGIATVMLIGDQPATALAIAKEVGLWHDGPPEVIDTDALAEALCLPAPGTGSTRDLPRRRSCK